ncbi:Oleate hydratase [Lactococcus lactis]|nr:Oleate hydratase [Lactococcus lactis]
MFVAGVRKSSASLYVFYRIPFRQVSAYYLSDKQKLEDLELSFIKKQALKVGLKKIKGTYIEELLEDAGLI